MKRLKLKESTEFLIVELMFYLLVIFLALIAINRFTNLEQIKSADITAQNIVVNN